KVIADAWRDGNRIACENSEVRGFPFRLGLHCDSVLFESAQEGISFAAGAFRSAAQVYQPNFLIGELDGEARLHVSGFAALNLEWERMRASVRLARPLPERISIESHALKAFSEAGATSLFNASMSEIHMRPNGQALDLAAT